MLVLDMEKLFNNINLLLTLHALQGIIFALIFIFNQKKNAPLRFLGLFLLVYVSTSIQWVLEVVTQIKYLPFSFVYLIAPFFYLYIKNTLGIFQKKDFWHLLPALIEFSFHLVLFIFQNLGDSFYTKKNALIIFIILIIIPTFYNAVYTIKSILLIKKHQKIAVNFFTNIEKKHLHWAIITCVIFLVDYTAEFCSSMLLFMINYELLYLYIYQTVTSFFIVYWISIYGLQQQNINAEAIQYLDMAADVLEPEKPAFSFQTVEEPFDEAIDVASLESYQKIIAFFKETKIYKDKDISLFKVADSMQLSYRDISRLIKKCGQKNFNQFVNEFRIRDVKELLVQEDKLEKFNLYGLAQEVGFNSRSSFFTAFKSMEGKTPLEFKKEQTSINIR